MSPPTRQVPGCLLGLLALALVAGCDRTVYDVCMQPLADGFRRVLECRRVDRDEQQREVLKPMPQEDLDRLAAVYGEPAPLSAARRFSFVMESTDRTPEDVGGAGHCRRWRSCLGSLWVYAERFRGSDDQAAVLDRRLQAVDRLTELLLGWLEPRLGQSADWGPLKAFLAGAFRQDLRNLALIAWAADFAQDAGLAGTAGKAREATPVRVLLFLSERGYLQAQDIPAWRQALEAQGRVQSHLGPLAPLVTGALARRVGLAPDSEALAGLRRDLVAETMVQDLAAWLRTTPEWQALAAAEGQVDPPGPMDVLGNLALTAAGLGPGAGRADELTVRLALPLEPAHANGSWDPAKQEVSWQAILPGPEGAPFLAYASWAVPDEAAQGRCFGRVVLRGAALAGYLLWVEGLSPEERAEWEAFLDRLRPEGEPAARLAEFRFAAEMAAGPPTAESLRASRAQSAREVLLQALEGAGEAPRP